MGLLFLAAIALGAQPELARAQTTATYTVKFKGNWNTSSTPDGVAGSAHFTTLIGAVHDSDVTFWAPGGTATSGVEGVAELGVTSTFETEITAAGADVRSKVKRSGTSATGTRTFEVEFSRTHPLLTLLSRIGPSPDWFVGVSGLSLLDSSDAWRSSHTVDLFPYDAGTEDGEEFLLSNAATVPQGTITSIRNQGKFSNTRMARLSFTLNQDNAAPEFSGMSTTRSFAETAGDATVQSAGNVGAPVTATDLDNDMLTYTLEGADKDEFTIDSNGQIKTKAGESYDRETKASYSVMVKADDRNGGTDTIAVTVTVTDAEEKPLAPAAPSVSTASATSVNVMWNAPSNGGRPAITSYDLQYRQGMTGSWTDGPQGVTSTSSEIMNLTEDTEYQVQVRASNSDGDGTWSEPGTGRTNRASVPPPPPPTEEETEEEVEEVCAVSGVTDDQSLEGFVECAAESIEVSDTFEETLRLLDEFRDGEGNWNDGSTYLVLLTRRGGVYFHANDREVEDMDWSGILSCEGEGSVLDTQEGCLIEYDGASRGYAHPFFRFPCSSGARRERIRPAGRFR